MAERFFTCAAKKLAILFLFKFMECECMNY